MITCMQGVGDVWTDPQFHTGYKTDEFGKGNLEQMGIDGFFKSHKCNSICEFLGIGKDAKVGMGTMAPAAKQVGKSSGGFKSGSAASSGHSSAGSGTADSSVGKGDEGKEAVEVKIRDDQHQQSCCSVM
jgi:hypothetical protein